MRGGHVGVFIHFRPSLFANLVESVRLQRNYRIAVEKFCGIFKEKIVLTLFKVFKVVNSLYVLTYRQFVQVYVSDRFLRENFLVGVDAKGHSLRNFQGTFRKSKKAKKLVTKFVAFTATY